MNVDEMSIWSAISHSGTRCVNADCDNRNDFGYELISVDRNGSLPRESVTCNTCGVKWYSYLGHREVYDIVGVDGNRIPIPRDSGAKLRGFYTPPQFGPDTVEIFHAVRELLDYMKRPTLTPKELAGIIANIECRIPQDFTPWTGRWEDCRR